MLLALATLLALPVAVLLVQVLAAITLPKSQYTLQLSSTRPSVAILIPAHNESLVIAKTIQTILPQLSSQDQLLVVADNCTEIGRAHV